MSEKPIKVVLAVEHDGKKPDSTVELPAHVARDLIRSGRARAYEPKPVKTTKEG